MKMIIEAYATWLYVFCMMTKTLILKSSLLLTSIKCILYTGPSAQLSVLFRILSRERRERNEMWHCKRSSAVFGFEQGCPRYCHATRTPILRYTRFPPYSNVAKADAPSCRPCAVHKSSFIESIKLRHNLATLILSQSVRLVPCLSEIDRQVFSPSDLKP